LSERRDVREQFNVAGCEEVGRSAIVKTGTKFVVEISTSQKCMTRVGAQSPAYSKSGNEIRTTQPGSSPRRDSIGKIE